MGNKANVILLAGLLSLPAAFGQAVRAQDFEIQLPLTPEKVASDGLVAIHYDPENWTPVQYDGCLYNEQENDCLTTRELHEDFLFPLRPADFPILSSNNCQYLEIKIDKISRYSELPEDKQERVQYTRFRRGGLDDYISGFSVRDVPAKIFGVYGSGPKAFQIYNFLAQMAVNSEQQPPVIPMAVELDGRYVTLRIKVEEAFGEENAAKIRDFFGDAKDWDKLIVLPIEEDFQYWLYDAAWSAAIGDQALSIWNKEGREALYEWLDGPEFEQAAREYAALLEEQGLPYRMALPSGEVLCSQAGLAQGTLSCTP